LKSCIESFSGFAWRGPQHARDGVAHHGRGDPVFTLLPGLAHSALPSNVMPWRPGITRSSRTTGVLPMRSGNEEPSSA
jgi:hypothetical protein